MKANTNIFFVSIGKTKHIVFTTDTHTRGALDAVKANPLGLAVFQSAYCADKHLPMILKGELSSFLVDKGNGTVEQTSLRLYGGELRDVVAVKALTDLIEKHSNEHAKGTTLADDYRAEMQRCRWQASRNYPGLAAQ